MLQPRCDTVGSLEDRLSNIEAEISSITTLLKSNRKQRLSIDTVTEDECSGANSTHNPLLEDSPFLPSIDRHIIRRSSSLTDRYHGPGTLVGLCHDFSDGLLPLQPMQTLPAVTDEFQPTNRHPRPVVNDLTKILLDRICLEAEIEDSVDLHADPKPIRLPPQQFLSMIQAQFFQQADHATDLFVQSSFWSNVERIYSRPFTPADEAWAICFNTIILLTIGPEVSRQHNDIHIGSQFVRPFLSTVRSVLSNPRVFMVAKLVNVQALALLVSYSCDIKTCPLLDCD